MSTTQRFLVPRRGAAAIVAASLLAGGLAMTGQAAAADTRPLRIMALGDSITEGHIGSVTDPTPLTYRYSLDSMLDGGGYAFDLVGTRTGRAGRVEPLEGFDADHEGRGGWRVDHVLAGRAGDTKLSDWLGTLAARGDVPDVVLVHLGTNDIRQCEGAASTADELRGVISTLRAGNPQVTVLLAEIIPAADYQQDWIGSFRCGSRTVAGDIAALNTAIRALAAETSSTASRVVSVDQHSGFSVEDDLVDGVHANAQGDRKLAQRWYDAIRSTVGAATAPPTTAPPTTSPSPTTPPTTAPPTASPTTAPPTTAPPTTSPSPTTPPTTPAPASVGYWLVDRGGVVHAFGDAAHRGDVSAALEGAAAVDLEPTPSNRGYWVLDERGRVHARGDAAALGHVDGHQLGAGETATSLSATASGRGYWVFTTRGRALPFGDAVSYGDMSGQGLNAPVLDSITTPSGRGYWMVAGDGGIFAFGDAAFHGSMGAAPLNAPVQSLVADPDGQGYWLVAADGGVFAFHAGFHGSMGGQPLNRPVTGMVAYGSGYLMVAEDGGVFTFSDLPFQGSLGARPPATPVVAIAPLR